MSLSLFDPFNQLVDPHSFFGEHAFRNLQRFDNSNKMQVTETDDKLAVEIDCPGLQKKDIQIRVVNGNVLSVSGGMKQDEKTEEDGTSTEVHISRQFKKQMVLPRTADPAHISAKVEHGVLSIDIPKQPRQEALEINVN